MTSAKRMGNKWQVAYNTIEFAETGNNLLGLVGNYPLEVSGRGGFADFFVWRDAVDERMEANRQYKAATDELWRLLSNAKGSTR